MYSSCVHLSSVGKSCTHLSLGVGGMSGGLLQIATSRTPWRRTRISVVDGGGCDSAAVEETPERFDTIFGIGGVGEVPGGP